MQRKECCGFSRLTGKSYKFEMFTIRLLTFPKYML